MNNWYFYYIVGLCKEKKNKMVYCGITTNPDLRKSIHLNKEITSAKVLLDLFDNDSKKFTLLNKTGIYLSRKDAEKIEDLFTLLFYYNFHDIYIVYGGRFAKTNSSITIEKAKTVIGELIGFYKTDKYNLDEIKLYSYVYEILIRTIFEFITITGTISYLRFKEINFYNYTYSDYMITD